MSRTLCLCTRDSCPLSRPRRTRCLHRRVHQRPRRPAVRDCPVSSRRSRGRATRAWRAVSSACRATSRHRLDATCIERNGLQRWSYTVGNRQAGTTICGVTFPIISSVRIGPSWEGNRVYWPSMYQGTVIDDSTSAEASRHSASNSCRVPHLYGKYQGDLCLPFAHSGPDGRLSVTVRDGSHEVFTLPGYRRDGHGVPGGDAPARRGGRTVELRRHRVWRSGSGLAPCCGPLPRLAGGTGLRAGAGATRRHRHHDLRAMENCGGGHIRWEGLRR